MSRCISVIHPHLQMRGTSAASATSWCSASTRKLPTQAPYRYSISVFLKQSKITLKYLYLSALSLALGWFSLLCSFFQLLKGVGTKCWAPDAEYALHSVYQGGLFELRAGDEIFVSVSSPTMVNAEESASYFGAFRLDLWEERIGEKWEAMGHWMDKQMDWRAWGLLNIHWLGGKMVL